MVEFAVQPAITKYCYELKSAARTQNAARGKPETREVEMKKLFIFILLATIQPACSIQAPQPEAQPALLSFADLAAEITVNRVASNAVAAAPRSADARPVDSAPLATTTRAQTVVH